MPLGFVLVLSLRLFMSLLSRLNVALFLSVASISCGQQGLCILFIISVTNTKTTVALEFDMFLTWWLKSAPIDGLILFHLHITYLPLEACIVRVHALVMWVYDVELFFLCRNILCNTSSSQHWSSVIPTTFYLLSPSLHWVTNNAQPRWVTRGLTVMASCRWQVKEA